MRLTMMVAAAMLLAACDGPLPGDDGGMPGADAARDAGAVVICDDGVARCPPYYVPVCGGGTVWDWDPIAMLCGTRHGETRYPGPRRIADCSADEPCPRGSAEWCLAPMTFDGGIVCQGNEAGE